MEMENLFFVICWLVISFLFKDPTQLNVQVKDNKLVLLGNAKNWIVIIKWFIVNSNLINLIGFGAIVLEFSNAKII
jgi:hypothetical protein